MDYELFKNSCLELGISENSEEFRHISEFFESTKRSPAVTEVTFVREALIKAYERATFRVKLREAECCSDDFRELLSNFIARYTKAASGRAIPYITELAEYATTGKIKQNDSGIIAEPTNQRTFPIPYSGSSETLIAGDIRLTLSYGKPLGGSFTGDICTIIAPAPGQTTDEFIEKATCACRDFSRSHPQIAIKPVTHAGLLSDLAFLSSGYVVDTRLLPSPSDTPEAIFGVTPPALLLFPKREDLHELWMTSAIHGLTPTAPIASRAKFVSIRGGDTSLEYTKDELEYFNKTSEVCLNSCDSPKLEGDTETLIADHQLKYSSHTLTAIKLGGENIYESLEESMKDPDAIYAVSGILNVNDPSVLPIIITLDSFRRNNSPRVTYSSFFIGKTTSIYVFKLSKKK